MRLVLRDGGIIIIISSSSSMISIMIIVIMYNCVYYTPWAGAHLRLGVSLSPHSRGATRDRNCPEVANSGRDIFLRNATLRTKESTRA